MTNLVEDVHSVMPRLPSEFFRAFEFLAEPPMLELQGSMEPPLSLLIYGQPGTNYVLQKSSSLGPGADWTPAANFILTNSFLFIVEPMTNESMFYRVKRQ